MSHKTTNSQLLVEGYIHENEKQNVMIIPSELGTIILMFYPKQYKLYGIGSDEFKQFGLKQECEANNKTQSKHSIDNKWHYLSKMSSLFYDPNFISCANDNFFIVNIENDIYGIGNNQQGSLGVDSHNQRIEMLTKISFKDKDIDNNMDNHILDIMSNGAFTNHTFIVLKNMDNNNQRLYGFGNNTNQQQGYKSDNNYFPTKIPALNTLFKDVTITQINTGYNHSLFLTSTGSVYGCGLNMYGQCGIQIDANTIIKPQIIPFLYDIITHISCGQHHNICIDKNNRILVFGRNNCNQLGLGEVYKDIQYIDRPTINPYFKDKNNIIFIECGDEYSLCINKNGKAYLFGENSSGQCGNSENGDVCIPFCIQSMEICKNVLFESGSCGCSHTVLISYYPNNSLYGFGSNDSHQTGNMKHVLDQKIPHLSSNIDIGINENDKIVKVICDDDVTLFISEI